MGVPDEEKSTGHLIRKQKWTVMQQDKFDAHDTRRYDHAETHYEAHGATLRAGRMSGAPHASGPS
jgi:hypothetical protein